MVLCLTDASKTINWKEKNNQLESECVKKYGERSGAVINGKCKDVNAMLDDLCPKYLTELESECVKTYGEGRGAVINGECKDLNAMLDDLCPKHEVLEPFSNNESDLYLYILIIIIIFSVVSR